MRIALGSDHVGLLLKRQMIPFLEDKGYSFRDLGTYGEQRVDYPEYGRLVGEAVASGACARGLLFCGTGVGMSISANKVRGVRAVVASEPYSARMSRLHNDTNVLALGSRVVGPGLAWMIIETWLGSLFEGGRHQRRVELIGKIQTGADNT
jgi:ribose 5-phosphate isomerase B